MKKEKLEISFGKVFNIKSENPSNKTILIFAMVLLYSILKAIMQFVAV